MGATQIPATTPWLELGTSSPTSGLTVSFTSLPEYNNYRVQFFGLEYTGSAPIVGVRFNSDSGSNYAQESAGTYSQNATYISFGNSASQAQLDVEGSNEVTKKINGFTGSSNVARLNAMWNNQDKITSIQVVLAGTATGFTAGTIKVFGKN